MIEDTKFDESIRLDDTRGAGIKTIPSTSEETSPDCIRIPPESKSTVKDIQRKFGEVAAVDVQKYKRQGEVVRTITGDHS